MPPIADSLAGAYCSQRASASEHEDLQMNANKPAVDDKKATTIVANDPDDLEGTLKRFGGSQSDHWNTLLANQAIQTLWLKHSDQETRDRQMSATVAAMGGIGPKDELEGMMAAQLLAAHNAAMECYRRAMVSEQTFEGRRAEADALANFGQMFVQSPAGFARECNK
jgi:hypothetical protein